MKLQTNNEFYEWQDQRPTTRILSIVVRFPFFYYFLWWPLNTPHSSGILTPLCWLEEATSLMTFRFQGVHTITSKCQAKKKGVYRNVFENSLSAVENTKKHFQWKQPSKRNGSIVIRWPFSYCSSYTCATCQRRGERYFSTFLISLQDQHFSLSIFTRISFYFILLPAWTQYFIWVLGVLRSFGGLSINTWGEEEEGGAGKSWIFHQPIDFSLSQQFLSMCTHQKARHA